MRIWKIALLVDDVNAAETLYHEVLGMKVISRLPIGDAGECVFLDAGDVQLELIPKAIFAGEERLSRLGVHHLSFKADDVEGTSEMLKAKGVNFLKEPFEVAEGLTVAFFDGLNGVNLQLFSSKK
jgi:catechol 2,3-dioxygenase-like lactoylglutathione lyase family enzyme